MNNIMCSEIYMGRKLEDIEYVKSEKPYVIIHYIDGSTKTDRKSLAEFEKNKGEFFVRTNRQYLVNLIHVKKIDNNVMLESGASVGVSRRKKSELICKYREYSRVYN